MNNDDMVCNRFKDLANACYNKSVPISTDFLDLYKQTLFNSILKDLPPVSVKVMGGYDLSERKIIQFLPYSEFECDPPYKVIHVIPVNQKFSDELSHRDVLGAVLNLGISRDKIGDILVEDKESYIFCVNNIADFLIDNLIKVKHTMVTCSVVNIDDFNYSPKFEEIKGTVASLRLDTIIALGFKTSRNHIISSIEEGLVAVNGRIITSNAYSLKEGDIISCRGYGKIRFSSVITETKKGRIMVTIDKYV